MKIREYTIADLSALRSMHERQGFGYPFPEIHKTDGAGQVVDNFLFLTKVVLVDENDVPRMAGLGRITCESDFLMDPDYGTPRQRLEWLVALERAAILDGRSKGLEDCSTWVGPNVPRGWVRRIEKMGWRPNPPGWVTCTKRF